MSQDRPTPIHDYLVADQSRSVTPPPHLPNEPDSMVLQLFCLEDTRFEKDKFKWKWEAAKTVAAQLNQFAGRTIERVEYTPLPLGPDNPVGNLGAFIIHFIPLGAKS